MNLRRTLFGTEPITSHDILRFKNNNGHSFY